MHLSLRFKSRLYFMVFRDLKFFILGHMFFSVGECGFLRFIIIFFIFE